MNIARKNLQIFIRVYYDSFKPPLKQMPFSVSFYIKINSIAHIKPMHSFAYVCFRSFYQEVIMIIHQAIAVNY